MQHVSKTLPTSKSGFKIQCPQGKGLFDKETLIEINRETLKRAFQRRHNHAGYMAEYQQAKALVDHEIAEKGSTSGMLASWF